ncbi:unnamed protein product [Paramecium pentaurelia]|uniref:Transmembrane protein n=1 Tax=Paramecium pentaurelia TaxID=43138 RepID=A0A8S1SC86_9CILI|nr:unnamed protein product [Paramecium pentaurelia]
MLQDCQKRQKLQNRTLSTNIGHKKVNIGQFLNQSSVTPIILLKGNGFLQKTLLNLEKLKSGQTILLDVSKFQIIFFYCKGVLKKGYLVFLTQISLNLQSQQYLFLISHRRIDLSLLPEANVFPSGEKQTDQTLHPNNQAFKLIPLIFTFLNQDLDKLHLAKLPPNKLVFSILIFSKFSLFDPPSFQPIYLVHQIHLKYELSISSIKLVVQFARADSFLTFWLKNAYNNSRKLKLVQDHLSIQKVLKFVHYLLKLILVLQIINCQKYYSNCLQYVFSLKSKLQCVLCNLGYVSSVITGYCIKSQDSFESEENIQVIQGDFLRQMDMFNCFNFYLINSIFRTLQNYYMSLQLNVKMDIKQHQFNYVKNIVVAIVQIAKIILVILFV